MSTRLLLPALSCGLLALSACADVEHCREGQPGCLAGPPRDGSCALDLVLTNGTCSEPGASAPPLSCQCQPGEICTLDRYECVDYCEPLDVPVGGGMAPPAIACEASMSFEELCQNRCLLHCRQLQTFCAAEPGCEDTCAAPATQATCQTECGGTDSPTLCMAQHCGDTRSLACRNVACPGGQQPSCNAVICRNACEGYNFDGVCDDGDLTSAASGICSYGSDCADCGARVGEPPEPQQQGGPCAFHSGCVGASPTNLAEAEAWCLVIDPEGAISRCSPDCSDADETCPAGSACFVLLAVDQDGDGIDDPLVQEGRTASACFPNQCK